MGNSNPELHPENLIVSSSDIARINGKKGGLKKAELMRQKKTFKNILNALLENKITDSKKIKKILKRFPNLKAEDLDQKMAFAIKFAQQTSNSSGEQYRKNFKELRDTIGETPVIKKAKTDTDGQDIPIINDDVK